MIQAHLDGSVRRMLDKAESARVTLFIHLVAQVLRFNSMEEARSDSSVELIDIDEDMIYSAYIGSNFPTNGLKLYEGKKYDELVQLVSENTIGPSYAKVYRDYMSRDNMRKLYESGATLNSCEYLSRRESGLKWVYSTYMLEKDPESGKLFAYLLIFQYDSYRRCQEEMMNMALRDQLTGLYNRYMLKSEISTYIDHHNHEPALLIAFDLNKFKDINDTYRHHTGDRALHAMAERLEKCFYNRHNDFLFRTGGDEFLVFLENTNETIAVGKIEAMLREPLAILSDGGERIEYTTSAGYTVLRDDDSVDSLIKRADEALYYVKEHGRRGYVKR